MSTGHTRTSILGKDAKPASVRLARGGHYGEVSFPYQRAYSVPRVTQRGYVQEFSRRSRRRLMNLLQQIDKTKCKQWPLFITLTYPDVFPEDGEVWKSHLHHFQMKLQRGLKRRYAAVWRLELQVRKSGEHSKGKIAPHFHLLLFCDRKPSELRFLVSKWWAECVNSSDPRHRRVGTNVAGVRSWRGVMSYASKYMGKVEALHIGPDGIAHQPDIRPGKFWGVWNKHLLPIELIEYAVTVDSAIRVRRIMRRHAGLRPRGVYDSMSCYMSGDAIAALIDLFGGVPDG